MLDLLLVVLALAAGGLTGWLLAARRAQAAERATADELAVLRDELASALRRHDAKAAELDAWRDANETHRRSTEQTRKELEDAFGHLSAKILASHSEQFLQRSEKTLGDREKSIQQMLAPFQQTLERLQKGVTEIEGKREKAYGALEQHLEMLKTSTQSLGEQSRVLETALRGDSQARGHWGEVALQNVVEFAGMTKHCDFECQVDLPGGGRPDMVVNLPGGEARIPVDAKVPMAAYMKAVSSADPDVRAVELRKHAADLRGHVRALSRRRYADKLDAGFDYTVLFIPADPVLSAAFEADPGIQQDAFEKRVLIATPVTLIALLRTVALYWEQSDLAENAQKVWEEGREFHRRVTKFFEHMTAVGRGLDGAVRGFNDAVGSYQRRVLPQGRRLEELEGSGARDGDLPDLRPVERALRDPDGGGASDEPAAIPSEPEQEPPALAPPTPEPKGAGREADAARETPGLF